MAGAGAGATDDELSDGARRLLDRVEGELCDPDRKPVVFLFGAALTMQLDGRYAGVPNVRGIVERLKKATAGKHTPKFHQAFAKAEADGNYGPAYQAGFQEMYAVCGVERTNGLVRDAVLEAYDGDFHGDAYKEAVCDPQRWRPLSPALRALGQLLAHRYDRAPLVLTTNFDPLIEVATFAARGNPRRTVLDDDGQLRGHAGDGAHVAYLHGYWCDSDMMHTETQLEGWRPVLHGELQEQLERSLLVVLGYGGWDDVVMRVLDAMAEQRRKPEIAWSFFHKKSDPDEAKIAKRLAKFGPRAQFYEKVNLHRWLPALDRRLASVATTRARASTGRRRGVDNLTDFSVKFVGREKELKEIRQTLAAESPVVVHPVLSGLGGMGKSRLAAQYAHENADAYDIRWIVRCASEALYYQDMAALGRKLGLPDRGEDDEAASRDTLECLSKRERWLLVLDNVEAAARLPSLVPHPCPGHVLITSRATAWRGYAEPIDIKTLEPAAAKELLLARSGEPDDGHCAELAAELGHLPLALVQAAAFIEHCGQTFGQYLADYRARGLELFDEHHASIRDYETTVAKTWLPNIEAARREAEAAGTVLELLSFLDPDGVPESMLETCSELSLDSSAFNNAIAALRKFSLVERNDGVVRVHRLVQDVTRRAMKTDAREAMAGRVVPWVARAFAYEIGKTAIRLVPQGTAEQVAAVAGRIECRGVAPSALAWALERLGHFRQMHGMLSTAGSAYETALEIAERHGGTARDISVALNFLGFLEAQAGNLSQARILFDRFLHIAEKLASGDPSNAQAQRDISVALNFLGNLEVQAGNLSQARTWFSRFRSTAEKLASDDPSNAQAQRDLSVSLSKLGNLEVQAGDLSRARTLFGYDLDIVEKLARDDPSNAQTQRDLSVSLNKLGDLEVQAGNLSRARTLFDRSLDVAEKLASDDPSNAQAAVDVAISHCKLFDLDNRTNDPAGAQAHLRKAETILQTLASRNQMQDSHQFQQLLAYITENLP